jgi:iron-sulfur cluster assembly accessory protein
MAIPAVLEKIDTAVEETTTITLSPTAQGKLQALLTERNIPDYGLRVFVAGGGCSGLQYGMAFEAKSRDFDTVIDQGGVHLFVDPTSMMYLAGATIDFVDSLMGGGFKIENPNAASSCGCGHSFRTKDSGATDEGEEEAGCGSGCSCH